MATTKSAPKSDQATEPSAGGLVPWLVQGVTGIISHVQAHPMQTLLIVVGFVLYTVYYSLLSQFNVINLIVARGNQMMQISVNEPTPTPVFQKPETYGCDPNGICNSYGEEQQKECPTTFTERTCQNKCGDVKNRCKI